MNYIFCFPRTFSLIRRNNDGKIQNFSVKGMARMDFAVNPAEFNRKINKGVFLLAPDFEILPGDIICDGEKNFQLHKTKL